MLDFLPSLCSLLSYGSVSATSKKAIHQIGRHKAIVYTYIPLIALLIVGAVVIGMSFSFPQGLIPFFVLQVCIGALGVIANFKALNYGKSSIISPVAKSYVLLVLVSSVIFLGEELSLGQIIGSLFIVSSALILAMDEGWKLKFEKWMIFLGVSMLCRAFYYTSIKTFVLELGAYEATLFLELGITIFVISFHALRGRDLAPPAAREAVIPTTAGALIFIGSVLYSFSVSLVGAALTAAINAAAPIVNAIMSYFILGEKLDIHKYAATLLTVLGLIAIVLL